MPSYSIRAYLGNGDFAFGATLFSPNDETAIRRFNELQINGRRAELLKGRRLLGHRDLSSGLSVAHRAQR